MNQPDRTRALQVPTGLAVGLEVGSPLPSACALAGDGVTDAPLAARESEPPVVPPYRALTEPRDGVRSARIRQVHYERARRLDIGRGGGTYELFMTFCAGGHDRPAPPAR